MSWVTTEICWYFHYSCCSKHLTSHACALLIDNVGNYLYMYLNNGSFKSEVDPHQFNLRERKKIFKSWQVCDWLAKWLIVLGFMDLRWPRVYRRSNVGLVGNTTMVNYLKIKRMASQITSLTIVYSNVYSGSDQRKHQSSASLAFVRGIHRGPVNSPHKWPVTRKMFPFDDVIMRMRYIPQPINENTKICILKCIWNYHPQHDDYFAKAFQITDNLSFFQVND